MVEFIPLLTFPLEWDVRRKKSERLSTKPSGKGWVRDGKETSFGGGCFFFSPLFFLPFAFQVSANFVVTFFDSMTGFLGSIHFGWNVVLNSLPLLVNLIAVIVVTVSLTWHQDTRINCHSPSPQNFSTPNLSLKSGKNISRLTFFLRLPN